MTKLTRRKFLKTAAFAVAGALVTGFKKVPTKQDELKPFLAPLADACDVQFRIRYGHCKPAPVVVYGVFETVDFEHSHLQFIDTEQNVWDINPDTGDYEFNGMPVVLKRHIKWSSPPPDVTEMWRLWASDGE